MKRIVTLLVMLVAAGAVQADEQTDDAAQMYVADFCTIALQAKPPATADEYISQMKNLYILNHPTAVEQSAFDEDEARTVVAAWMNLSTTEKTKAQQSQQSCQNATFQEYQSQD